MRNFLDSSGDAWQVTIGKASWGTMVLLLSPVLPGGVRTSILQSETMFDANVELEALTDDELRTRLADSQPWG